MGRRPGGVPCTRSQARRPARKSTGCDAEGVAACRAASPALSAPHSFPSRLHAEQCARRARWSSSDAEPYLFLPFPAGPRGRDDVAVHGAGAGSHRSRRGRRLRHADRGRRRRQPGACAGDRPRRDPAQPGALAGRTAAGPRRHLDRQPGRRRQDHHAQPARRRIRSRAGAGGRRAHGLRDRRPAGAAGPADRPDRSRRDRPRSALEPVGLGSDRRRDPGVHAPKHRQGASERPHRRG